MTEEETGYICPHCGLYVLPSWGPCAYAIRRWADGYPSVTDEA